MPRFIDCDCDGGTYVYDYGEVDRHDGSIIEYGRRCERCDGSGLIEVEDEPITEEDLEIAAPIVAGSNYLNRTPRTLEQAQADLKAAE